MLQPVLFCSLVQKILTVHAENFLAAYQTQPKSGYIFFSLGLSCHCEEWKFYIAVHSDYVPDNKLKSSLVSSYWKEKVENRKNLAGRFSALKRRQILLCFFYSLAHRRNVIFKVKEYFRKITSLFHKKRWNFLCCLLLVFYYWGLSLLCYSKIHRDLQIIQPYKYQCRFLDTSVLSSLYQMKNIHFLVFELNYGKFRWEKTPVLSLRGC